MRVCFVQPPAVDERGAFPSGSDFDRYLAENSSTGLITLAAVLEKSGVTSSLVDLSRLFFEARRSGPVPYLAHFAAEHVARLDFDVLGVSTMCSTYPTMLRFATELKRRRPESTIILGGPQASVVDLATLEAFDAIDLIVRGEADETLPRVLDALCGRGALDFLPGITFRTGGRVVRNPDAPGVVDLDSLPLPSYDLLPGVTRATQLHLEIGRGCPFACTFCSTNDFFRRRFRLKSPRTIIGQMTELKRRYKVTKFDLTHDMFTVDRRRVVEFCESLLAIGAPFRWRCSARTDCVDRELLQLMADAGCAGVFFGLESGSERIQKAIDKRLDTVRARAMVRCAGEAGIGTTAAFIVGFPEEDEIDLSETLGLMFEAMAQRHVTTQISLLAPLAGTPIYHKYREALQFDGLSSDMCQQGYDHAGADRILIERYRDIFPNFYTVPTCLDKGFLLELSLFLTWSLLRFRWLLVAASRLCGGPLPLCRKWMEWRNLSSSIHTYYESETFQSDALSFFACFRNADFAIHTLVTIEEKLRELREPAGLDADAQGSFLIEGVPVLAPGVGIFFAPGDPEAAIQAISSGVPMPDRFKRKFLIGARIGNSETEAHRLSGLLGAVLPLCNGARTCAEIAEELAARTGSPLPGEDATTAWLATIKFIAAGNWIRCDAQVKPPSVRRVPAGVSGRSRTSL